MRIKVKCKKSYGAYTPFNKNAIPLDYFVKDEYYYIIYENQYHFQIVNKTYDVDRKVFGRFEKSENIHSNWIKNPLLFSEYFETIPESRNLKLAKI